MKKLIERIQELYYKLINNLYPQIIEPVLIEEPIKVKPIEPKDEWSRQTPEDILINMQNVIKSIFGGD